MPTEKTTLTIDSGTLALARGAAAEAGLSLSAYVTRATRAQLRRDGARALAEFAASDEGRRMMEEMAGAGRRALTGVEAADRGADRA